MAFVIQQQEPKSLGELLGTGISKGIEEKFKAIAKGKGPDQFTEAELVERGFSPEEAAFFKTLTTGGKTALGQTIVERMQREKGFGGGAPFGTQEPTQPQTPEQQQEAEVQKEIASADLHLTPKEKFTRQEGRFKVNTDLFAKTEKSLRKFDETGLKLDQLERLNEKGDLPKGLGRMNVNFKTGELLIPAAASPDAQLFVKTINDFLTAAKDTFGARVTNFEVDRFLKRLPSLANTEEGRSLIIRQMGTINKINQLQEKGVIDAFNKAGGIRNLDFDAATRIGRKQNLNEINALKKEFAQIGAAGAGIRTTGRVAPGTKLTANTAQKLLKRNKGNVDAAMKEASELGFDIGE